MSEKRVIDPKYLPTRLPVGFTIMSAIALYYWNADGWVIGAVCTLLGLIWISALYNFGIEEKSHPKDLDKDFPS